MSKDTIKVNMNVYDIPILVEQLKKLEQENKHLNLQLDQALKDYEKLLVKIDKAIEYIKKLQNFKIKYVMFEEKELYATENDFVKELLEILGDKE